MTHYYLLLLIECVIVSPSHDPNHNDLDDLSWEAREALEDPDGPQACDLTGQDDETETVACPSCGESVPEFADRCHHCGDWIIPQGQKSVSNHNLLFVAVVFLLVLVLLYWLL